MGTTVLNGTSWPLNRERMARYQGFARTVDNAYDASQISSMDQPVEVSGFVTSIALHTGNVVEDMLTQYAQARPWILLAEGGNNTYVSSAMPQKRYPGRLNRTGRDASTTIALATGVVLRTHNITPGMSEAEFRSTLDPVAIINNRASAGGPQPSEVARMIKASQQILAQQADWIKARRAPISSALSQLDSDSEKLLKN